MAQKDYIVEWKPLLDKLRKYLEEEVEDLTGGQELEDYFEVLRLNEDDPEELEIELTRLLTYYEEDGYLDSEEDKYLAATLAIAFNDNSEIPLQVLNYLEGWENKVPSCEFVL